MLGSLLAFAFPVGAASNDHTTIEFKQGDKVVKVLSLDAIRIITPAVSLKIFEAHENQGTRSTRHFRSGLCWITSSAKSGNRREEIVFTSIDGYPAQHPGGEVPRPSRLLRLRKHADNAPFTTTNPVQNNEVVQLGPLYLVWDNLNSKVLLASGDSDFPTRSSASRSDTDAPFPKIAPPPNASAEVKRGYMHFRQHCVACHTINGEGGGKAPELNYPTSVVEYIKPEYLRRWIMSPQSIRYNTRMPALPRGIPNAEQVTEELITYLKVMSIMKRDPAQR